jgi:hypothetical protein
VNFWVSLSLIGAGAEARCLGRDEASGMVGETQERTCVAIVPRNEGHSPRCLDELKGADCVEAGVAREDSVAIDGTDVCPMLSDMERATVCCWGVKIGRDGEGVGRGVVMQSVGATG